MSGPEKTKHFLGSMQGTPGRWDIWRAWFMKAARGELARTKVGSNSGDKMEMFLYWIIILIFNAMKFKR
jgi:hypothetical protein